MQDSDATPDTGFVDQCDSMQNSENSETEVKLCCDELLGYYL